MFCMRVLVTAVLLALRAAKAALPPRIELNLPEQLDARLVQTTEDINGIPCDSWGADKKSCADMSRVHHTTYYAICEVGKDDASSCPEPQAEGYDHHEGVIPVTKRVLLFVEGPKHGLPRFRREIVPKLDYNIRGEYTLVYDAHDSYTQSCPLDCITSEHVLPWTQCTKSCGTGLQSRHVVVLRRPAFGGKECPNEEEKVCNTQACPTPAPTPVPTPVPTPRATTRHYLPPVLVLGFGQGKPVMRTSPFGHHKTERAYRHHLAQQGLNEEEIQWHIRQIIEREERMAQRLGQAGKWWFPSNGGTKHYEGTTGSLGGTFTSQHRFTKPASCPLSDFSYQRCAGVGGTCDSVGNCVHKGGF